MGGLHSCNSCGCGFLVAFRGLLLNLQQCQQCWSWEECRWHGLESGVRVGAPGGSLVPGAGNRGPWSQSVTCVPALSATYLDT